MICGYLKSPASSTGSLTVKSLGPELAEGCPRRAFVILAYAGIHFLQLVSLDSRLRGNDGREPP